MRRTFGRHQGHLAALTKLTPHERFLDAAVAAAGRHQSVFDAAVDLGLGRGTAPGRALLRVAEQYVTLGRNYASRSDPTGG